MAPTKTKKKVHEVKIEDIEFQAVEECTCAKICKRYIELLEEDGGHYPELMEACKDKLLKLDKKMYYSMFATQAKPEEVEEAIKDILSWEEDVKKTDASLSENVNPCAPKAPIRGNDAVTVASREVAKGKEEDTRTPNKKYARDEQSMEQYYKKWGSVNVEEIEKEIDEQEEKKRREFEEIAAKQQANKPTFDYDAPDTDALPEAQREYLGDAEKAKGNEAFYAKDFEEALAHYTKALAFCPAKPSIWANRALAKLRLNDSVGAEEDCRKALEFDVNYMKPWHRLGKALFEQGRYDEAYEAFRKAQRLDSYNQQINTDLMKTKKKVKPKEEPQTMGRTTSRVLIEELSDEETPKSTAATQPTAAAPAVNEGALGGFTRVQIEEESDSEKDVEKEEDTKADVKESKTPADGVNALAAQTLSPPASGFTQMVIEEESDSEEDAKLANASVPQTSSPLSSGFTRMLIEEESDSEEDAKPASTAVAQASSPPASDFTQVVTGEESNREEDAKPVKASAPQASPPPALGFTRMLIEEENDSEEDAKRAKTSVALTSSPPAAGFTRMLIEEESDSEEDAKPAKTSVAQTSSPPASGFTRMLIEEESDSEEDAKPGSTSVAQASCQPDSGFTQMLLEEENDSEGDAKPANTSAALASSPPASGFTRMLIEEESDSEEDAKPEITSAAQVLSPPASGFTRMLIEEESDSEEDAKPAKTSVAPTSSPPASGFTRMLIEEESDSEEDAKPGSTSVAQASCQPDSGFTQMLLEEENDSEGDAKPANTSAALASSPPASGFTRMLIEEESDSEEDAKPENTSAAQTSSPPVSGFTRMLIEEESGSEKECAIKPASAPVPVTSTTPHTVPEALSTGTVKPLFVPPPRQPSAPTVEPTQTYLDESPYDETHLFTEFTIHEVEKAKQQANKLFAEGNYGDSVRVFDTILSVLELHQIPITQAIHSIIYSNRAFAYLKLEQWERAKLDCSEAVKKNESNTKAFYRRALALCELGEFGLAASDIEIVRSRLGDAQVKEIQARIDLGLQEKNSKKTQENEDKLRLSPVVMEDGSTGKTATPAVTSPPSQLVDEDNEVEFRDDDGFVLVNHSSSRNCERSCISDATPYIDPAICIAPTLEAITEAKNRGNALFGNAEYEKAERTFTKCLHVADTAVPPIVLPDALRSILHCNCAFALIKQEQWLLAEKECTAALTYNDGNVKALYRRAWARLELDMLEKALADCKDVARREGGELPKVREIRERIEKAQKLKSELHERDFVQVAKASVEVNDANTKNGVNSHTSDWVAVDKSDANTGASAYVPSVPPISKRASNVTAHTASTIVQNGAASSGNTRSSPLTTPSTGSTNARLPSTNDSVPEKKLPAKAPRSIFEFDRHLRGMRNSPDSMSQYLKSMVPSKLLSKLYSHSEIDVDILAMLIEALGRIEDQDTRAAYVNSIQKTRNSKVSILMLPPQHQQRFEDLCNNK